MSVLLVLVDNFIRDWDLLKTFFESLELMIVEGKSHVEIKEFIVEEKAYAKTLGTLND